MFETYFDRLASGQVSLTPTMGQSDKDKGSDGQSRQK